MNRRSAFAAALVASFAFAASGCAASEREDASSNDAAVEGVTFEVEEISVHSATLLVVASYDKTIEIRASGPITAAQVFEKFLHTKATGPNGLCASCESATPESEQNDGHGHIHIDKFAPGGLPVPGPFRGDMRLDQTSATTARLHVEAPTNSLDATLTAVQISPTVVHVVEDGTTAGTFPETFAQLHNKFVDLRAAIERELER